MTLPRPPPPPAPATVSTGKMRVVDVGGGRGHSCVRAAGSVSPSAALQPTRAVITRFVSARLLLGPQTPTASLEGAHALPRSPARALCTREGCLREAWAPEGTSPAP